jgi:hypothetical protein
VVLKIANRHEAWLLPLAFPGVIVNLTHGQNGFLAAALPGGARAGLDNRCLAASPISPRILLPLVLVVTARWRALWLPCRNGARPSRTRLRSEQGSSGLFGICCR